MFMGCQYEICFETSQFPDMHQHGETITQILASRLAALVSGVEAVGVIATETRMDHQGIARHQLDSIVDQDKREPVVQWVIEAQLHSRTI